MRFLAACLLVMAVPAQAEVLKLSEDTYLAIRSSKAGIFVSMAKLKIATIREANDFAARLGKVIVPISTQETPPMPGRWPTVEYQFRLVEKEDPAAKGGALLPRADVVIESKTHNVTDITHTDEKKPDLYTELTKLDDLRKRGLLTDEEFAQQKKRLLQE
jgi:hypothetical protein